MNLFYSKPISALYRKFQIYINEEFKKYEITSSEYSYLITLVLGGDGIEQNEMTKITAIDKAAVTRGLQSLEKKGYIKRFPLENNTRHYRVYMTEQTLQIKDEIIQAVDKWNKIISAGISSEDLIALHAQLEQLADNACKHIEKMSSNHK